MSLVIALLAFVFNYLIRPFETNYSELRLPYFWVAFIHSVSPIAVLLPMAYLKARQHAVDNWQVKNEFRFIFFLLLVIGIVQFLLRDILYDNPLNWSWSYLIEEVYHTMLVGSLLAFGIVSANLNIQFFRNSEHASQLNEKLATYDPHVPNLRIEILKELKTESFFIDTKDFIFAKSEGNYVEIWLSTYESSKPYLERMPLKELEKALAGYSKIIKTHRSYLLNTDFIEKTKGNAQGYKITLKKCNEIVPVSRNFLQYFDEHMSRQFT